MTAFLSKFRGGGAPDGSPKHKKADPLPDLSPLERILRHAGPIREDGSDKFYGLENFGNTCYCNSVVQALYHSESFRENVVTYPPFTPSDTPNGPPQKVTVARRAPMQQAGGSAAPAKGQQKLTSAQVTRQRQIMNGVASPTGAPSRPEDRPNSPEYKKKQAMIKGPVLELAQEHATPYGMDECTFTGLKDIFTALIESSSRTGVLSPQRFLDIFKRDNENFRNSMHQDAHEFYILVLNDVIATVEANSKRLRHLEERRVDDRLTQSVEQVLSGGSLSLMKNTSPQGVTGPGAGWVHDIFEGVLTSETRCLTCETASQRDETFLDLSIDLEEHSSVTSCLRKFSAEEMLCERNKFHCDHCGGLQEAEKRIKIKKLPRVLALHLKRFKYTDDYGHMQKLFHRVVYPYHLRMFNTTDDAEDPDRMYELYAVIVHIGGHAYHGHYVSVIKTKDRGWLLFDDEMVEPVDKHFVRNFFGDRPGQACAYVLFYQQTTFEKVRDEMNAEGQGETQGRSEEVDGRPEKGRPNGFAKTSPLPVSPVEAPESQLLSFEHAQSLPEKVNSPVVGGEPPPLPRPGSFAEKPNLVVSASSSAPNLAALNLATKEGGIPAAAATPATPTTPTTTTTTIKTTTTTLPAAESERSKSKKEKAKEKKEHKAQGKAEEKARKRARQREKAQGQEARRQANQEKTQKIGNESQETSAEEMMRKKHGATWQKTGEAATDPTDPPRTTDDGAAAGIPAVDGVADGDSPARKDEQKHLRPRSSPSFLGLSHRSIMRKNRSFSFLGRTSGSDNKAGKEKVKDQPETENTDDPHAAGLAEQVEDGIDALMISPVAEARDEDLWPLPNGDKRPEPPTAGPAVKVPALSVSPPAAATPATESPLLTPLSPVRERSEGQAQETNLDGPARQENKFHKLTKHYLHQHHDGNGNNKDDDDKDNKPHPQKPAEPTAGKGQHEQQSHENKGGLRDLFNFKIRRKPSLRLGSS